MYAFGVVLYELISAKEAIVKTSESDADSKGLVALVNLDFFTQEFYYYGRCSYFQIKYHQTSLSL